MKKVIVILVLAIACSKKEDPTPKINIKPNVVDTTKNDNNKYNITISGLFTNVKQFQINYKDTIFYDTIKIVNIEESLLISGRLTGKSFSFNKHKSQIKTRANNIKYVDQIAIQDVGQSSIDTTIMIYEISYDRIRFTNPKLLSTQILPNNQKLTYNSYLIRK